MTHPMRFLLACAILFAASGTEGLAQDSAPSYYLIGNSLTWDTVPSKLNGDVQWHVDCAKSLPYIYANPAEPCVKTSTLWPEALRDKQYDFISVQPHYGSTLAEDVETISAWMKLQPKAVFVIHSGWARHAQREDEFASFTAPNEMVHSPGYMRALIAELRRLHPERELRQTFAHNLLATVAEDIAAQRAPLENLEALHRDAIHMTLDQGRYLMHNAMRRALGQPRSADGFEKIPPAMKTYLDGVLDLLETSPTDQALLAKILSSAEGVDRSALISEIADQPLQEKLTALLPEIERASNRRRSLIKLEAEVEKVGGKVVWSPTGPQWLYLASGDRGVEIFDVPTTIELYNGNNPLKGKGGRNEQVNDEWLARLSDLDTLRRIDLSNCAVQGDGLRHVGALTGLRELNLTLTPVSDEALKHLGGLTDLRSLGLASTQCTGTGFTHLKNLRKLESVNFHFTPLNDAGLEAICRLPISDRLWFAHTHFTDKGAAALASLKRLKQCGIGSKEPESSGEAVAALVGLPLVDLALLDNQATTAGVAHAAKIATLRRLDVSHGPTVTDEAMPLVARMPALEEFKLGSAQITDAGLMSLAASKSLKKLTLNRNKHITPAGIEQLQKARPDLTIEVQ